MHDPKKSDEIPVTQKQLELVKQELKSEITAFRLETRSGFKDMEAEFKNVDSKFKNLDSRFESIDSRFESVDSQFKRIDARFDKLDSRFELMQSTLFGMKAMFEEQNSRNRIVLDGYTHMFHKQECSDVRIAALETRVFGIDQK